MSKKLVSRFRRWYWGLAQPARRRNPLDRVIRETRPLPVPSERRTARQALALAAPIAAEFPALCCLHGGRGACCHSYPGWQAVCAVGRDAAGNEYPECSWCCVGADCDPGTQCGGAED